MAALSLTALSAAALVLVAGPSVRRHAPNRPPVVLDQVRHTLGSDGRTLDVTVKLTNSRARDETARIWWILAAPGDGPPWGERRAHRSPVRTEQLVALGQSELRWTEAVPVPAGTFEVWAFVHVRNGRNYMHSDGRVAVRPTVTIGSAPVAGAVPAAPAP